LQSLLHLMYPTQIVYVLQAERSVLFSCQTSWPLLSELLSAILCKGIYRTHLAAGALWDGRLAVWCHVLWQPVCWQRRISSGLAQCLLGPRWLHFTWWPTYLLVQEVARACHCGQGNTYLSHEWLLIIHWSTEPSWCAHLDTEFCALLLKSNGHCMLLLLWMGVHVLTPFIWYRYGMSLGLNSSTAVHAFNHYNKWCWYWVCLDIYSRDIMNLHSLTGAKTNALMSDNKVIECVSKPLCSTKLNWAS
jgi:hypothetical protein